MKKNQIEHIKTAFLVFLVFTSFLFSGYLWYSTPASQTLKPDNDLPPYIFKNPIYSNKERHELISPFEIIVHQPAHSSLVLPESNNYKPLVEVISQLDISEFNEIHPTTDDWLTMARGIGIECLFSSDSSYELIEAISGNSLPYRGNSKKINSISRIRIFRGSFSQRARIWLISEKEQKVAEAYTQMNRERLEKLVFNEIKSSSFKLAPFTLQGYLPWETNNTLFSRIFYFPTTSVKLKQLLYSVENISIDNMKQWLFRDPDIKPLIPNADESFYMFNDQLLNFNKKHRYMTYSDSSSVQTEETLSLSNQLDQIKNFMKRHQGWTGFYLLDEIQKEELYLFRLFKQGYPVFWPDTDAVHNIHPDLIQVQTDNTEVSKYIRSMYYLSGKPNEVKTVQLPGRDKLLTTLRQRGIPLRLIERIFPGYMAEETSTDKKKQIQLNPVWVIKRADGKKEFVN